MAEEERQRSAGECIYGFLVCSSSKTKASGMKFIAPLAIPWMAGYNSMKEPVLQPEFLGYIHHVFVSVSRVRTYDAALITIDGPRSRHILLRDNQLHRRRSLTALHRLSNFERHAPRPHGRPRSESVRRRGPRVAIDEHFDVLSEGAVEIRRDPVGGCRKSKEIVKIRCDPALRPLHRSHMRVDRHGFEDLVI
ncbi:hypothetical protein DsansV1_C19g0161441 [Dioscorea sansibarensis]